MNHDDIIRLAREACKPDAPFRQYVGSVDCGLLMKDEHLERFAALVAVAEREACAKACDQLSWKLNDDITKAAFTMAADTIRARGEK